MSARERLLLLCPLAVGIIIDHHLCLSYSSSFSTTACFYSNLLKINLFGQLFHCRLQQQVIDRFYFSQQKISRWLLKHLFFPTYYGRRVAIELSYTQKGGEINK
jgi:hypothetical protein